MAQTMLEAALAYASQGFAVFPVKPDKKPLTEHGLKDATQHTEVIKNWWTKWPNAGIAIPTQDLIVLDCDLAHDGLKNKGALEDKYQALPSTRQHRTGGGGLHLLFRNPNGSDVRNTVALAGYPGLDIRANGGYIVVPPSYHQSGKRYEVLDSTEIAFAPDWLVTLAKAKTPLPLPNGNVDQPIPEGQRNQRLAKVAGAMRRQGLTAEVIEAALKEINQRQCQPPLPDEDIARLSKSISRYPPAINTDIPDISQLNTDNTDTSKLNLDKVDNSDFLDKTDKVDMADIGKNIWRQVDEWLQLHQNEPFDLDTICRQLDITRREARHHVVKKLSYEVGVEKLEKSGKVYRSTSTYVRYIDWVHASTLAIYNLKWPRGRGDGTGFGFDGRITVSPGDVIVLAGVSNSGKTAFCLNLVWENMNEHPVRLMGNEYSAAKFKRRTACMDWAEPLDQVTGLPKFALIKRYENWKDVIEPDALNIIDWINLADNFYQIGSIIEGIQSKLKDGIAIISIQKGETKMLGRGGDFSRDLASIYLAIDFGRLTVVKAKEWSGTDPNGRIYGFELGEGGVVFSHIRQIKECRACGATGKSRGGTCGLCEGKGYIDA